MGLEFGEFVVTRDGSFTIRDNALYELYHSEDGALYEAENLYVGGSGIFSAEDLTCRVSVLDVGLGLGYNAMMTLEAWSNSYPAKNLEILSLELNANLVASLASGEAVWQRSWPIHWLSWCRSLRVVEENELEAIIETDSGLSATWRILVGNASHFSTPSEKGFDYVWQDPFSPGKAPELWSKAWFEHLKKHASPGCQLMTYSVARQVRENLTEAGWQWEKINTPGKKKHWLRASLETYDA